MNGSSGNRRRKGTSGVVCEDEDSTASLSLVGGQTKEVKGILTSLTLLEEQEKRGEAVREGQLVLETNRRNKTKVVFDYYLDLDGSCTGVEEIGHERRKKCRASMGAIAGDVGCGRVVENGGKKGGGGGELGRHRRLWVKDRSNAWWDECKKPMHVYACR